MRRDHAADLRRALADVARVVAALGLEKGARRQATGLLVCCPWHQERTPSCSITRGPDGTLRAKCFGCDASGDVLALVAQVRGLDAKRDFTEVLRAAAEVAGAYDILAELGAGSGVARGTLQLQQPAPPPEPPKPTLPPDLYDRVATRLLELALLDGEVADYLAGRGLLAVGRAAGLGALPAYAGQGKLVAQLVTDFGVDTLVAAGLVFVGDSGEPDLRAFRSPAARLLIPWRAPGVSGAIDVVQRRRIDAGQPKYVTPAGRRMHYPFGADLAVEQIGPDTSVAFVEGALDVLALRAFVELEGLDVVALGIPGVSNWSPTWATFARGRVARIALDADGAGEAKVAELAAQLHAAGAAKVTRLVPPKGAKDWADALAAVG